MSVVPRISDSSRTSRHFREGPNADIRALACYGALGFHRSDQASACTALPSPLGKRLNRIHGSDGDCITTKCDPVARPPLPPPRSVEEQAACFVVRELFRGGTGLSRSCADARYNKHGGNTDKSIPPV